MTYIYDLILNFNKELLEFYEWEKSDDITHIKRMPIIKVTSKVYNEFLDNEIIVNKEVLSTIFNKCEYFEQKKIKSIPYAFLLTDSYRVIALITNNNGNIIKYSSLLLDEEEDTLEVSIRVPLSKISYNIVKKKEKNYLTRRENIILDYIKKELNDCLEESNINELKYLYYEYFNKEHDDINVIYDSLMKELDKEITNKHYNLYNLIKLTYSNRKCK